MFALDTIDVIDVTTKSTIQVPRGLIYPTAFQQAATSGGDDRVAPFTVCELFQKGKCERKEACRHVHVDPEFLRGQRASHFVWMHEKGDLFAKLPPSYVFEVFNATMKEVMEVQKCFLEFTRGLFLSPEDRDRRVQGAVSASAYCGKVPTACLLFLGGTCKWGEHCNQAHISKKWLNNRNREFQAQVQAQKALFASLDPNTTLDAYHPNLNEVVKVPQHCIVQFTRGIYQAGDKTPSICLLAQKNRCGCAELCKQLHVDAQWMATLRKSHNRNGGRKQQQQQQQHQQHQPQQPQQQRAEDAQRSPQGPTAVAPSPVHQHHRAPDNSPLFQGGERDLRHSAAFTLRLNASATPFSPGTPSGRTAGKKSPTLSPILVPAQAPVSAIPEACRLGTFEPLTLESSRQCIDKHSTELHSPTGDPDLDFLPPPDFNDITEQLSDGGDTVVSQILSEALGETDPSKPPASPLHAGLGSSGFESTLLQAIATNRDQPSWRCDDRDQWSFDEPEGKSAGRRAHELIDTMTGMRTGVLAHLGGMQQLTATLYRAIAVVEDQCDAKGSDGHGPAVAAPAAANMPAYAARLADLTAQFAALAGEVQTACHQLCP